MLAAAPRLRRPASARVLASTLAVLLVSAATLTTAPPARAAGPGVTVSPTSGLDPAAKATLKVSGSGFNATGNNKFGVYVAFGPKNADYATNASAFLAAMWVHPGASGGEQAEMTADGRFSTTLSGITAQYTDGSGKAVNCLVTLCYVITIAAHGLPDRSQDTFTPITFATAASPTTAPTKPATASPTNPPAAATPAPSRTPISGATSAPVTPGAPATPTASEVALSNEAPAQSTSPTDQPTVPTSQPVAGSDGSPTAGAATDAGVDAARSSGSSGLPVAAFVAAVAVAVLAAFGITVVLRRRTIGRNS